LIGCGCVVVGLCCSRIWLLQRRWSRGIGSVMCCKCIISGENKHENSYMCVVCAWYVVYVVYVVYVSLSDLSVISPSSVYRATRQDPKKQHRPLSTQDLRYIHRTQFDGADEITATQFGQFWKWFGKILHKIRHQKPLPDLWKKGWAHRDIIEREIREREIRERDHREIRLNKWVHQQTLVLIVLIDLVICC
jgi:hypothetical protein